MSECKEYIRCGERVQTMMPRRMWVKRVLGLVLSLGIVCFPSAVADEPPDSAKPDVVRRADRGAGSEVADVQDAETETIAGGFGLCNPTNICGDPDCSTATKCSAGCFGNPICATRCGGHPCNATCNPCASGCPNRCDLVLCPGNALCLSACGGSGCNVGCNPGPCGAGCPDECDSVLCPQNVVPCIWNVLNTVSDRVDTTINRARAVRDAAEEVRDGVRDGIVALTGDLRMAVDGALSDLERIVGDQLGGAEFIAFTDGSNSCSPSLCEPFRQQLFSLLLDFESNANTVFSVSGLDQLQLDFARMRGVIAHLPGRVLFPLYRVVGTNDLLGSLSTLMAEMSTDLDPLGDIFATDGVVAAAEGTGTPICTVMTDSPDAFEAIVIGTTARAIGLKVVAKLFDALGETSTSADAGIHGYVHITYTDNFPKKLAAILESMSDSEFYIADAVEAKLEFCLRLQRLIDAQQWHFDLMDGHTSMLDSIRGNADLNYDGETDLKDFALFQRRFGD